MFSDIAATAEWVRAEDPVANAVAVDAGVWSAAWSRICS
jgi:hypothetical protein